MSCLRRLGFVVPTFLVLVAPSAWGADEVPSEDWKSSEASASEGEAGEDAPPEAVEGPARKDAPAARAPRSELGLRPYHEGLAQKKLSPTAQLSTERLRNELALAEEKLAAGRTGEVIADVAGLVESSRFDAFRDTVEGRSLRLVLGEALGRTGADAPARAYLVPLIAEKKTLDLPARRAVRAMVELGLESDEPEAFVAALTPYEKSLPEELAGDVAYLRGRSLEKAGRLDEALSALRLVEPRSRFWAQAVYLSGVIETERGRLKEAEELFCKVADPKLTPKEAPVFGGADFFEVRDLARLGLGRVAHEGYRFDDAQYYYYLVPRDSVHLPEALYEAATTRYEAKDYEGARDYLDDLVSLHRRHVYQDERYILEAYVDMASCKFGPAEQKLEAFLKRYEPVRNAARQIARDPGAVARLVDAVDRGTDAATVGLGVGDDSARTLASLLRVDDGYNRAAKRLARLERQLRGLDRVEAELGTARAALAGKATDEKALRPQAEGPLGQSEEDQRERARAQIAEIGRLLREARASGKVKKAELDQLEKELEALRIELRQMERAAVATAGTAPPGGASLEAQVDADRRLAGTLRSEARALRSTLQAEQVAQARSALERLDLRLSRLVRRARLGRIETVLGKKRSLEVEIEALAQGFLPPSMVDSLDVARYLGDDEEYWPDDGEDWADEYVGGEGVR